MYQKLKRSGNGGLQLLFWIFPLVMAVALSLCLWFALDHAFQHLLPVMDQMLKGVAIL